VKRSAATIVAAALYACEEISTDVTVTGNGGHYGNPAEHQQ